LLCDTERVGSVLHVFTHFSLDLAIHRASTPVGKGWWQRLDRLPEAGLPTLYRRAAELVAGPHAERPLPLEEALTSP
jgi:A/G-specific adenine glycosylase